MYVPVIVCVSTRRRGNRLGTQNRLRKASASVKSGSVEGDVPPEHRLTRESLLVYSSHRELRREQIRFRLILGLRLSCFALAKSQGEA